MRHFPRSALTLAVMLGALLIAGGCGDDGDAGPDLRSRGTSAPTDAPDDTAADVETSNTTAPPADGGTTTSAEPLGEPTLDERSSVSTTGLDTVTFGMTVAQAERAAGTRLVPDETASSGTACRVVVPESGPAGVAFTVTNGTIERVDIRPPATVGTRSGVRIGTKVADLQQTYGDRISVSPSEPSAYVFTPRDEADAAFRLVFVTDGATVTSYRSGRVPQVEPAASC